MEKPQKCQQCGKRLIEKGSTYFPCPQCGKLIGRCKTCRENSSLYHCECGFSGP